MPSPMNGSGYNTPDLHRDDLFDEAIELLYSIVHRASSSPDHSSRALFNAYEEVLEEHGLLPSDDAVLHRFLFRMQKDRRRDESLVERFSRVLVECDIVVDVEFEGEGVESTSNANYGMRNGGSTAPTTTYGGTRGLTRRGSFDSFFNGTADKVAGSEVRDAPRSKRRGSLGQMSNGVLAKRRSNLDTEALRFQQSYTLEKVTNSAAVSLQQRSSAHRHSPSTTSSRLQRSGVTCS